MYSGFAAWDCRNVLCTGEDPMTLLIQPKPFNDQVKAAVLSKGLGAEVRHRLTLYSGEVIDLRSYSALQRCTGYRLRTQVLVVQGYKFLSSDSTRYWTLCRPIYMCTKYGFCDEVVWENTWFQGIHSWPAFTCACYIRLNHATIPAYQSWLFVVRHDSYPAST